jgi:hypothetical protein
MQGRNLPECAVASNHGQRAVPAKDRVGKVERSDHPDAALASRRFRTPLPFLPTQLVPGDAIAPTTRALRAHWGALCLPACATGPLRNRRYRRIPVDLASAESADSQPRAPSHLYFPDAFNQTLAHFQRNELAQRLQLLAQRYSDLAHNLPCPRTSDGEFATPLSKAIRPYHVGVQARPARPAARP